MIFRLSTLLQLLDRLLPFHPSNRCRRVTVSKPTGKSGQDAKTGRMLVPWGLKTLLIAAATAAVSIRATPLSSHKADTRPAFRVQALGLDIFNSTELGVFVDEYKTRHILPRRTSAKIVRIDPSWIASPAEEEYGRHLRRVEARQDQCSGSAPIACVGTNGSGPVCTGCSTCCPDGAGGFQCCGQGFKCCVASNGAGSCCPDDGGVCCDGGCSLLPYV